MRERTEEARCAPRALRAGDGRADAEADAILATRRMEGGSAAGQVTMRQICSTASLRKALLLGCGLQMLQQLSGINTVMCARRLRGGGGGDSPPTPRNNVRSSQPHAHGCLRAQVLQRLDLSQTGFSDDRHAVAIAAFVSFANFCGTVIGMLVVDRNGRRRDPVMPPSAAMLGVLSYTSRSGAGDGSRWVVAGALAGYLLVFAPGMGLPWVINAEVYPSGARTLGNAAATANWTCNLLVSALLSLASSIGLSVRSYMHHTPTGTGRRRRCPPPHPTLPLSPAPTCAMPSPLSPGVFGMCGAIALVCRPLRRCPEQGVALEEMEALFKIARRQITASRRFDLRPARCCVRPVVSAAVCHSSIVVRHASSVGRVPHLRLFRTCCMDNTSSFSALSMLCITPSQHVRLPSFAARQIASLALLVVNLALSVRLEAPSTPHAPRVRDNAARAADAISGVPAWHARSALICFWHVPSRAPPPRLPTHPFMPLRRDARGGRDPPASPLGTPAAP